MSQVYPIENPTLTMSSWSVVAARLRMIKGTFQALMEHGYAGTSTQDRQTRQSKSASLPP